MNQSLLNKRSVLIVALVLGCTFLIAIPWTTAKSTITTPAETQPAQQSGLSSKTAVKSTWSKAVLSISNMSCGGCVENIKACLAPLPGIGNITVDVGSGSAEVYFDADHLTNTQQIADAITGIGYPAKIIRLLSAQQVHQERVLAANLAEKQIASVGSKKIPRKDYEIEVNHTRKRYEKLYGADTFTKPQGARLLNRIKAQIAQRLIDEGVQLQELDRAGYVVSEAKVKAALAEYSRQRGISIGQIKNDMQANDYPFDHFQKKFAQRVRLQSYLEEKILAESITPDDRQQRYADWLANARTLANVVYYDKDIEALVKSGGGAPSCGGRGGGGSCSGSGGNCSASL